MEVGADEAANSEAEPVLDRPDSPLEPADEQAMSELLELCPPRSEVPQISMAKIWEPKCSRCVVFRDNGIHYLRIISEHIAPRISALEALKPENSMLKKLNAELTTQLEESIQSDQTSKARATAAEEEIVKVREALESLEKDYYGMAKAAEEGKKHAHEASVWRVKYEKTVDICEKIQEKRKKESANFDKVLNLAEGYKKELDVVKKKLLEVKGQHSRFMESYRKHVPSMCALMKQIVSDSSFAREHPGIYAEASRLCSLGVKKSLKLPAEFDEEDDMSIELERLISGTAISVLREQHNAGSPSVAETPEPESSRPASTVPLSAPIDFVLSELNEEEADDLLEVGAEAATVTPDVVAGKRARGVARARGGGARRARGLKQMSKPSNLAASVNHDELNRRFNDVLEAKLKRTFKDATEPCTSGVKHLSIHGKKTLSVRAQQEAQMKVSIKEKVAAMKMLESSKKIVAQAVKDEVLFSREMSEIPEETIEGPVDVSAEFAAAPTKFGHVESGSPAKSKSSYSFARNDLLLSESPSPASSVAEGEVGAKELDISLLALEEFGPHKQQEDNNQQIESEAVMATSEAPFAEEGVGHQVPVNANMDVDMANEAVTTSFVSPSEAVIMTDALSTSRKAVGEQETSADTERSMECANQIAGNDVHEIMAEPGPVDEGEQVADTDVSASALLEQEQRPVSYATVVGKTMELETVDDLQKDVTGSISSPLIPEQKRIPVVPGTMMEPGTFDRGIEETAAVMRQNMGPDRSQNEAEAAITVPAKKSDNEICRPLKEFDSVSIAVAFGATDSEEWRAMTTLTDASSIKIAQEVVVNAEVTSLVDVSKENLKDGNDAITRSEETLSNSEATSSNEILLQLSQKALTFAREDNISRDSSKPHLAKDTKRALGVMRRLEDALKGKVEPIKDLNEISKKKSSHEEQPCADVDMSRMLANTEEAVADVPSETSPATIDESSYVARGAQCEASSETIADNETPPRLDSKIIEKDHQEAMRLHAELNRPPRRTHKDSEKISQDNLSEQALSKLNANAKQNPRRRTSQSEVLSAVSAEYVESKPKSVSKIAATKETFTNCPTETSDMMESILSGAHMGPADSSEAMSDSSVEARSSERHGNASTKSKSEAPSQAIILNSPASSKAEETALPLSGVALSNKSETCDVNASAAAVVNQKRSRGRPKNVLKDFKREHEDESKLKGSPNGSNLHAPTLRTRTRSRSSLISPPLSRRTSAKSSSEEVSVHEAKNEKACKIPMFEPHETRLAARKRSETIKSPTPSRSSHNRSTEEQLSSADFSTNESAAAHVKNICTAGSRKRPHESQSAPNVSDEPLSVKKFKSSNVRHQADFSPASRTRRKVDSPAEPISTLGLPTPYRGSTRTRPIAPKKRKNDSENIAAKDGRTTAAYASSEASDEDRLCVACGDEEEENSPQNIGKNVTTQQQHSTDEHLEEEDDEERLIIEDEEDEHESEMVAEVHVEGEAENRIKPSKIVGEETVVTGSHGSRKDSTLAGEITAAKLNPHKELLPKVRLPHIEKDVRNLRSSTQHLAGGVLQTARRSLPNTSSGIVAMQRVSSRISKQLQKVGSGSSTRTKASDISARSTVTSKTRISKDRGSQALQESSNTVEKRDLQPPKHRQMRGSKRRLEEATSERTDVIKKMSSTETGLEKKLHGALLSEQTIEVIRKNLGDVVESIAQMDPVEFASTMIKCSLNLPSGDMWTIVQARYRESESVDVHNKKEEMFINIAKKLAGSDQIWVEYVKGMIVTVTTQIPNAVNTTRYIRLLCQGLHQAGDLLTNEEKQNYLRAALTELFLVDASIAMKATVYALLSTAYECLVWMSNKDDPFSVLLSLTLTTYQNDGKILIWAWFQRFPKGLQLHDITPDILRKAFDDLLKRLAELAGEHGRHSTQDGSSGLSAELMQEEAVLFNTGASYVMPIHESLFVVRTFVDNTLKYCMRCIETAFNQRATDGAAGYQKEAFIVNSKLRFCANLILKAITFKDNASLSRDFCALLQEHLPTIREFCDGINESADKKPWMGVYVPALRDLLNLLRTLTQYEI